MNGKLSWGIILAVAVIVASVYAVNWSLGQVSEPILAASIAAKEAKAHGITWPLVDTRDDGLGRWYFRYLNPKDPRDTTELRVMRGPDGEWAMTFNYGDEKRWPRITTETASR